MLSESAAARRRRRVYHQRSLQGSGGSLSQYTEQLIPEADNEDDDDDDDLQQDERTSLIRHPSAGSNASAGSPRASGGGGDRRQILQHQHSAPPGVSGSGDWGLGEYLEDLQEPVLVAAGTGGGGGGQEEGMRDVEAERLAARRQQLQQRHSVAARCVPPQSPRARRTVHTLHHNQQQQQSLAAPTAPGAGQQQQAAAAQRWEEEDSSSSMTITPAAQRSSSTSSSGSSAGAAAGGVGRALSPSLCTASAAVVASNASAVASGVSSAVGSIGLTSPPPTGGGCLSQAHPGGAGGGGAGGAPRTPVIKKRTRFHQRSVTMMPATSPMTGPGVVSDDVGLLDREDRHGHHHHLDLAATYHSGVSSSSTSHRHQHHRGKTTTGSHHPPSRQAQHHIGTGKTSTPSLLFTKVKERIREKVFQSSEWPNAAAMMHEKRQRANDLLEASLNSRTNLNMQQIQLHGKQRKKMISTLRCKSDSGKYPTSSGSQPALYADPLVVAPSSTHSMSADSSGAPGDEPSSPDKEVVRDAFRRRSISEDTYDRQPCVVMKKNGVVCSNEDLEVIMQEQQSIHNSKAYKAKRSPRPLKKHLRTQSLDIARLQARENQQGPPGQTTHSSIYLDPQVSMESSSSTVSSVRTIDSASSEINLRLSNLQLDTSGRSDVLVSPGTNLYPEIVLDDKTKEIIMENKGVQQEDSVSIEDEESKTDGNKSKAVPEIIFDENGQTWDVYGAEFDPEVLGYAIQRHLEKMMERMMAPTMNTQEEDTALTGGSQCSAGTAESQVEASKTENSFWVRLLCLFAGRNEVAT